MKYRDTSHFKTQDSGEHFLKTWKEKIQNLTKRNYCERIIDTSLDKTVLYEIQPSQKNYETIIILPGFRTSSLIWDLDNNLDDLVQKNRVLLVEINGQPNLSAGNVPYIKTLDYGIWLSEIIDKLHINEAYIVGASFGGFVALKYAIYNSSKIKGIFLLNAAGLQSFSFYPKNLYYNLLPIIFPDRKKITLFLDKLIFFERKHTLSHCAKNLLIEYLEFVLTEFKIKAQTPYSLGKELEKVEADIYLILGEKDQLFPYKNSIRNAQKYFKKLITVISYKDVGHGIELYKPAIKFIANTIHRV